MFFSSLINRLIDFLQKGTLSKIYFNLKTQNLIFLENIFLQIKNCVLFFFQVRWRVEVFEMLLLQQFSEMWHNENFHIIDTFFRRLTAPSLHQTIKR